MKKLLLILALGTFAACNNGTSETAADSTANKIDSSADAKIDSVHNTADSVANKIDSSAEVKIDAVKGDSTKK